MRRIAILFAVIALVSPVQLFTGRRFAVVAVNPARIVSQIVATVARVRRFLRRQAGMLPGGATCQAARRFLTSA